MKKQKANRNKLNSSSRPLVLIENKINTQHPYPLTSVSSHSLEFSLARCTNHC